MRKGIMALEGLEKTTTRTPEVGDFADAPENDLIEMNEAQGEIGDMDADMDEAEQTADTLDKIGDGLEASAAEGGMSEPEAETIKVAVEHLLSRVGFAKRQVMPVMENFSDKTTRVQATMEAMEYVKEKGAALWKQIVAFWEKVKAWTKKFWDAMIDSTKKYSQRAETLIKAANDKSKNMAKKVDGKVSADGLMGIGGIAKILNIGGKMPTGSEFVSKYTEFANKGGTAHAYNVIEVAAYAKSVAEMIDSIEDNAKFGAAAEKASSTAKSMANGTETAGEEGASTFEDKQTFGQASLFTSVDGASIKVKVGPSTGSAEVAKVDGATRLTADEVIKVATAAKKHMDSYASFKKNIDAIAKIQTDTQAACKKAASKYGVMEKSNGKTNAKAAQKAAKAVISMTSDGATSIRSYDVRVTKAALDYCGASLGLLGKTKEPELAAKE